MVLIGIGLGVLSGSALKLLAPQVHQQQLALPEWLAKQPWIESISPKDANQSKSSVATTPLAPLSETGLPQHPFAPQQEITALSQRWSQQAATQPDLQVSAYMLILDNGRFAQMNANRPMPAASSIKTPILLAVLERIDQGTLQWNEPLTLTKELVEIGRASCRERV